MPFGAEQAFADQQQRAAAAAPDPNAPGPAPAAPADFIKRLAAAAAANVRAEHPAQRGIWNWITGHDADAAAQNATLNAPMAYDQMQQSRAKTQGDQLNLAQTFSLLRSLGLNLNPNNIPASYGGGQAVPPAASQPLTAPTPTNAPQTQQPLAPQANLTPANDVAGRRAVFLRLGRAMSMFPAYAAQGAAFMKMAQDGLPDNTLPLSNGGVGDAVTGQPINMGAQDYNAQGVFKNAQAKEAPHVAGEEEIDRYHTGNQAYLDTHRAEVGAQNAIETGIDRTTGEPTVATDYDIAHGRAPAFVKSNPYMDGQQKEIAKLSDAADSATQGLDLATQLANTANGLYTGHGAATAQNFRKTAQAIAAFTGTNLAPGFLDSTSRFEQLRFLSQQLVAKASHDVNPRVSQQIYAQIAAVKPGEASSMKGLRDIISNQIIPLLSRQRAMLPATQAYYRKNPFSNDAAAVVPDTIPLQNFSVKQPGQDVRPGEYYIDPQSGNIRQRPVQ